MRVFVKGFSFVDGKLLHEIFQILEIGDFQKQSDTNLTWDDQLYLKKQIFIIEQSAVVKDDQQ